MRSPEGKEYWSTGIYREIVPMERLVYTFEFEGAPGHVSLETVTLAGGSSYELATAYLLINLLFLIQGPGRFSQDQIIFG